MMLPFVLAACMFAVVVVFIRAQVLEKIQITISNERTQLSDLIISSYLVLLKLLNLLKLFGTTAYTQWRRKASAPGESKKKILLAIKNMTE